MSTTETVKDFIKKNKEILDKINILQIVHLSETEKNEYKKYSNLLDQIFNNDNYLQIKGLENIGNKDIEEFFNNFTNFYFKNNEKASFNNVELVNEYNVIKNFFNCIRIQHFHTAYSKEGDTDHLQYKSLFQDALTSYWHFITKCKSIYQLNNILKYDNDSFQTTLTALLKGFKNNLSNEDVLKVDNTYRIFLDVADRVKELTLDIYKNIIPNNISIKYPNIIDKINNFTFSNSDNIIINKPKGLQIIKASDKAIKLIFNELNFNDIQLTCTSKKLDCSIKDNILTVNFPKVTNLKGKKRKADIKLLSDKVTKEIKLNKCKVYCDLICHEVSQKLLKEFIVDSELTHFDNLTYVPIVVNYINSIKITLKDSDEQDYILLGDKIIECELHFQKDEK